MTEERKRRQARLAELDRFESDLKRMAGLVRSRRTRFCHRERSTSDHVRNERAAAVAVVRGLAEEWL